MNELRFLEVFGRIDDDLLREAEIAPERQCHKKPSITRKRVFLIGSVATAAVMAVGAAAFFNAHTGSALLNRHTVPESDNGNEQANSSTTVMLTTTVTEEEATLYQTVPPQTTIQNGSTVLQTLTEEKTVISQPFINTVQTTVTEAVYVPSTTKTPGSLTTPAQQTEPAASTKSAVQKGGVRIENSSYQPFSATIHPDSDSFREDELHHIDVRTADGFYRQLSLDDYAANGLYGTVQQSDFGSYIGKIAEVDDSDYHGNAVESQEPTLAGADVYYYAPAGKNKAFIIVKRGNQCSMFMSDNINESAGFRKGLAFFNVQSAEDIQSINCSITVPDGGRMVTSAQNTITDSETISALYDLLCQLKPEDYSLLPAHIGSPQWLTDAWAEYKADPNAPAREDYKITLELKDGTVLQEISYQPYLGNGYVAGMQELTPEQNAALRSMLK